ncbi:hypothetical protein D3C83_250880 [compost metagenome]
MPLSIVCSPSWSKLTRMMSFPLPALTVVVPEMLSMFTTSLTPLTTGVSSPMSMNVTPVWVELT